MVLSEEIRSNVITPKNITDENFYLQILPSDDTHPKVITPKNTTDDETYAKELFSKSFVAKFSSSWKVYAHANDIAKREKLKQALKDALSSMEDCKKSEILTNINQDTISRITHAASLLKEFKRMYALSENVKATLQNYNDAKSNLTDIAKTNDGFDLLTRFLVSHKITSKRNNIPRVKNNFIDEVLENTDDDILKEDEMSMLQKRYYIPSTQYFKFRRDRGMRLPISKTTNAFKKFRIVLNYMAKKYSNSSAKKQVIQKLIKALNNDMEKASPSFSKNVRRTEFPRPVQQTGLSHITEKSSATETGQAEAIESLISDGDSIKSVKTDITKDKHITPEMSNKEGLSAKRTPPLIPKSTAVNEDSDNSHDLPVDNKNAASNMLNTEKKRKNPFVAALLKKLTLKLSKEKRLAKSGVNKKDETPFMQENNSTKNASLSDTRDSVMNFSQSINPITNEGKSKNEGTPPATPRELEILRKINDESFEDELDQHFAELQNKSSNEVTDVSGNTSVNETQKSPAETTKSTEEAKTAKPNKTSEIIGLAKVNLSNITSEDDKTLQDEIFKKLSDLEHDQLKEQISDIANKFFGKKSTGKEVDINKLVNPHPTAINDDLSLLKKQQDTMRQLREAKLARDKYEVAKRELAEKIKELYILANDYEKQETSDQILEVKNLVRNSHTQNFVEADDSSKEYYESRNVKRDDSHPGIALSGIQHHHKSESKVSTKEASTHQGFTMGMADRRQHAMDMKEIKPTPRISKIYDAPIPLKLDKDIKHSMFAASAFPTKKSTPQEESLKAIATAIKEDMDEISKNEQKKKLLKSALKTEEDHTVNSNLSQSTNKKKGFPGADKIDEYLTKALAEFMGNDSISPIHEEDKQEKQNKEDVESKNRRIVESAMRQHAKNPNLPLPLVNTKGEKITLNKDCDSKINNTFCVATNALQAKKENNSTKESKGSLDVNSNDIFATVSDRKKSSSSTEIDPADKILLDKASHMEEQIAEAQEKLYGNNNSPAAEFEPASQNAASNLLSLKQSNRANQPLRSIPESMYSKGNGDPYTSINEHAEAPPHGLSPESPPSRPYVNPGSDLPAREMQDNVMTEAPAHEVQGMPQAETTPHVMQHLPPQLIIPPRRISPDEEEEEEDREQGITIHLSNDDNDDNYSDKD